MNVSVNPLHENALKGIIDHNTALRIRTTQATTLAALCSLVRGCNQMFDVVKTGNL